MPIRTSSNEDDFNFVYSSQVAIKVIDTRKIKEEYVRNNLHREASVMAQLRHPNIIRLYETLKVSRPPMSDPSPGGKCWESELSSYVI